VKAVLASVVRAAGCLGLLLWSVPVAAQDAAGAADVLFRQGREEMSAGSYESACDKFRQSDDLDPAPGTKLNLGECECRRGHLATAWELFQAVERQLSSDDPRQPIARSKREAVEPRVPRLELVLAPNAPLGTAVRVGKTLVGPPAFWAPLRLNPGRTELVIDAPGREERRVTVLLEEGKTTRVEIAPGPPIRPPPAASRAAALPPQTASVGPAAAAVNPESAVPGAAPLARPSRSGALAGDRTLGFALGGIGVGALVMSAVAGAITLHAKSVNQARCSNGTCDAQGKDAAATGRVYGAMTTAGLVVGAVGIGLGTYILIRSARSSPDTTTARVMRTGPSGAGLWLVRRW
jgi:hypothetical protein